MSPSPHPSFTPSTEAGAARSVAPEDYGRGWRRSAACAGLDPDLFFPVGSAGAALLQVADAKEVCTRCAVRSACLSEALEGGMEHGVWGGLGEQERRLSRRRRPRRDPTGWTGQASGGARTR
jgi:WhiB family redox-sensing transcriptional regulator